MPYSLDRILTPESPTLRLRVSPAVPQDRRDSMSREISNQPLNGATCGCHKTDTLQRILDAPGSIARRWSQSKTISGVEVLAGPGQPLSSQPMPGDILIRIVDGGSGHAALVTSSGLFHPEDLADHGMRADTESADGFVQVSERNESPSLAPSSLWGSHPLPRLHSRPPSEMMAAQNLWSQKIPE
jgi:hypothetical protein